MSERIRLYYYDTSGRLVFVRFLEEIEDSKNTFWNWLIFSWSTVSCRTGEMYVKVYLSSATKSAKRTELNLEKDWASKWANTYKAIDAIQCPIVPIL